MSNALLSVPEAAARASVHQNTIREAIRAGKLPAAGRVGRRYRIELSALLRWISGGIA